MELKYRKETWLKKGMFLKTVNLKIRYFKIAKGTPEVQW